LAQSFIAAACSAVCLMAPLHAQQDFASRADAYIDAWANDGQFIGMVAVARNGTPVYVKSVGMASTDWGAPNGADTKFRLGSITKQFTAVCILQLQEQRKLSVDQKASDFIEGLPVAWQGVTLHQMLSHTSGIPDYTTYSSYVPTYKPSQWYVLDTVKNIPMLFASGTQYSYSNTNFFLLGMVVERVSGMHYEDFVAQNLLAPAGMQNSGYDHQSRTIPGRATGYLGDSRHPQAADYIEMDWPFAAGALYSTVNDLIAWNEALQSGQLISPASLQLMRTPVLSGYGYGIVINSNANPNYVYHNGGINGFATDLIYVPQDQVTIVALSNFQAAPSTNIAEGIRVLYYGLGNPTAAVHPEVSVSQDVLARYPGEYQNLANLAQTVILTVTLEDGILYGRSQQSSKFALFPSSDVDFFQKAAASTYTFNVVDGAAQSVVIKGTPGALGVTFQRISDQ
jgi:CubicO group peptidase (beta-lactamase class C family)